MALIPGWLRGALLATAVMNALGAFSFTPWGAPIRDLAGMPAGSHPLYLPGLVLFAPADYHLLVERDSRVALSLDAAEHYSRPAIDVLFETASHAWGTYLLGVLFSGASEDGAAGLAAILGAGGLGWVESPLMAKSPLMPAAALREAPGARALTIPEMVAALAALPTRVPAPPHVGSEE